MNTYYRKNISIKDYLLIFICILYFFKILAFPLNIEMGGSEIHYIAYFSDYLNLFKNFEYTGLQYDRWHYQEWRWGTFIIPLILNFFFSFETTIFLSSVVIIFVSFCLILFSIKKYFNPFTLLFFSIFWIIHPDITKFTYSFSTSAPSFFAISIIIFILSFQDEIIRRFNKRFFLIFLLLSFFFFYGVRETNIIFFPFLIFYILKNFKIKNFYFSLGFGTILYLLETFVIAYITDWQFLTGRLFYHFFGETSWISFMQNDSLRFGEASESVKSFTRKFIDGGIFSRWYNTGLTLNFFYIFGLVYSIKIIFENNVKNKFRFNISVLYLAYFFTISFSFVNLIPLIPFIHFNIGIQIVGLPISLILFLFFIDEIINSIKRNIFKLTFVSFVVVLLSLKSLNHFYKVDYKVYLNNQYNFLNFHSHINKVYNIVNTSDCILIKGSYIHLLYLNKNKLNMKIKNILTDFIKNSESDYIEKSNSGKFYKINFNKECKQTAKIYKFQILK